MSGRRGEDREEKRLEKAGKGRSEERTRKNERRKKEGSEGRKMRNG